MFSLIVGFDSDWIHKLSTIKPTGWLRDCKDGNNGLHWGHSHPRIDTSPGWRCHLSWFWGVWAGGSAYCDTTAAFFPERSSKKFQIELVSRAGATNDIIFTVLLVIMPHEKRFTCLCLISNHARSMPFHSAKTSQCDETSKRDNSVGKERKEKSFFFNTHECSMSFYVMLYIFFYLEDILWNYQFISYRNIKHPG